jgi:hypothetical protein
VCESGIAVMRHQPSLLLGLASALVLAAAIPCSAQSRPFRGLFGSRVQNPNRAQSLTFSASVYAGWDDNALAAEPGVSDPRTQAESTLAGMTLGLQYGKRAGRVQYGAGVGTEYRYYADLDDVRGGNLALSFGMSAALSRRTQLQLSQDFAYQPFYQYSLFPTLPTIDPPDLGVPPTLDPDFVLSRESGWISTSNVNLERQLGRRSTLSTFYSYGRSDFNGESAEMPDAFDVQSHAAGVRFLRRMTRNASLHVGYSYRFGEYGADTPEVQGHDIDIGVDYARALTLSRRAHFAFSTGSSMIQTGGQRYFRVIGGANFTYQIARAWTASANYNRSMGFVARFGDPFFSDNVAAGLEGFLGRRVRLSFSAAYSTGDVGFGSRAEGFRTSTAGATAQYAFTTYLAAYLEYLYFRYRFPESLGFPGGSGPVNRNGVRGGLSLVLPILR